MTENSYICNFIKDNPYDWFEKLQASPYFLKIKEMDGLHIFNYNLLAFEVISEATAESEAVVSRTDFSIPLVQEARGIIIDSKKCEVVCWPFRKFGNYGEHYADDIDWNSASVQTKVDGSIIKLWFDHREEYNKWTVSTNSIINARNFQQNFAVNFGNIFDNAAKDVLDYSKLNKNCTYIFELVSPKTQVVIKYPEDKIYHLGTRSNITGEEFCVDIGVEKPKEYNLFSLTECIEAASKLNAACEESSRFNVEFEGFVVVDKNFNRIKVKSPEYLLAHHSLNNGVLSFERIIELIQKNECEEYLSYFPQFKDEIEEYQNKYNVLLNKIDKYLSFIKQLHNKFSNRKDFALFIKDDKYKNFAFEYLKNEDITSEELFDKLSVSNKQKFLNNNKDFSVINPSTFRQAENIEK